MEEWKEIIVNGDRYNDFTFTEHPIPFFKLFENKNIDYIQVHCIEVLHYKEYSDIVGFCGVCEWKNNLMFPLDGDTYYSSMLVYGYKWNDYGLDILVKDW